MAAPTEIARSYALAQSFQIGYQNRQFGVAGADVITAMAFPPTAMVTAEAKVENSNLPRSTPPT